MNEWFVRVAQLRKLESLLSFSLSLARRGGPWELGEVFLSLNFQCQTEADPWEEGRGVFHSPVMVSPVFE